MIDPNHGARNYSDYVTYDTGEVKLIDTIEHEGSLWLVPKWLDTPYPGMQKPVRMICLPKEGLQDLGPRFLGSENSCT